MCKKIFVRITSNYLSQNIHEKEMLNGLIREPGQNQYVSEAEKKRWIDV